MSKLKTEIFFGSNEKNLNDTIRQFLYKKELIDVKTCANKYHVFITVLYKEEE